MADSDFTAEQSASADSVQTISPKADSSGASPSQPTGRGLRLGFSISCIATTALSAFLVFQVQPIIAKVILPWFGGGPSIWSTCLLFFQLLLLGGYAYAHLINRILPTPWQAVVHASLVLGTIFLLPILPGAAWEPLDAQNPTGRILWLLIAHVGMPYLLLSASAPLLQAWYGAVHRDRVPYRLYALSNVGSLTALLSYPFVIEPLMDTSTQSLIWSSGFATYSLGCITLAIMICIKARRGGLTDRSRDLAEEGGQHERAGLKSWGVWMLLAALGTSALMAITNQLCQEVSVVPLLWVVPLSLYLLSFIICFDRPNWFVPRVWAVAGAVAILVLAAYRIDSARVIDGVFDWLGLNFELTDYTGNIVTETALFSLALFLICMIAHGQLVKLRPRTGQLTSYYLAMSAGGAAGGALVALVCPRLFSTFFETELVLGAGFVLAIWMFATNGFQRRDKKSNVIRVAAWGTVVAGLLVVVAGAWFGGDDNNLLRMRNFYGVVRVDQAPHDDPTRIGRSLYHGRTQHGFQYSHKKHRSLATTYYNPPSGVGVALTALGDRGPLRVGVVGLGVGTLATYGRKEDLFHFYEINEHIVTVAKESFTYLKDTPAKTEFTLGDARITLKRQAEQNFDLLVLDAFSGDAIPLHLLTVEAFEVYKRHLAPKGVIAVHVSNRYLDLMPVVAGLAEHNGLEMLPIYAKSDTDSSAADAASSWVLLTHDEALAKHPLVSKRMKETVGDYGDVLMQIKETILWTDQYSNLLQVLR